MQKNQLIWRPDTLWWIITGHCNLQCKHCYIGAPQKRYGQMTLSESKNVIDKVISNGITKFFITGGEPFLRKDIMKIFEYIYQKGGNITGLDSNGTFLNDGIINFLSVHNIFINISHDGINFTGLNRGIKNEEMLLNIVKKLIDKKIKTNINTIITPENIKNILKLFDKLKNYKINQWLLFAPFDYGNYKLNFNMLSAQKEADLYKKIYQKWLDANKPFDIRLGDTFDSAKLPTKWNTYACEYFFNTIVIFPDGQVTPCCKYIAHPDYNNFPNILKNSVQNILRNKTLLKYKTIEMNTIFALNPECYSCELMDKCNTGCRMDAFIAHNNILKKDERHCEVMKLTKNLYETK